VHRANIYHLKPHIVKNRWGFFFSCCGCSSSAIVRVLASPNATKQIVRPAPEKFEKQGGRFIAFYENNRRQ